ncbi:phage tail length tape measure family protein [Rhizobium oryzicola]|uniref:Phage tail length tape measure family protein n=1 Tax=Rhizobium oryzicola TaxID=1232668 RepID=A0ABT8SVH9_9HYPH|nr:phage tail length tape measure family protein [Rhizobium oryzicola]MDO1582433.1 phage tail length tape measure family protein [Rhizobium oryzicola]
MVVSIEKSMRFVAGMDASGYERGTRTIVAANADVASSSERAGKAVRETTAKISQAGNGLAGLERKFSPTAAQMRAFERQLNILNGALDKDANELERCAVILAGMQQKYRVTADAATFAAAGHAQLAKAIDDANAMMRAQEAERYAARLEELRLRMDGAYASTKALSAELSDLAELERAGIQITGGYEAALNNLIVKYDATAQAAKRMADEQAQVIARARAEQQQLTSQQNINSLTGVRDFQSGAARDSASVFSAAADEADRLDQSVARLRASINPLGAAQSRLNAEMAEYDALASRNLISTEELARAQAIAQARYEATARAIEKERAANDNKGSLQSYQLRNLMYQGTDLIQGLALGMPAQQVLLQQGPQIFDALNNGAGGLSGSLKALAGFVNPVTVGIAALAAGAIIGGKALSDYLASIKAVEVAASGLGRATAGTAQEMEAAAEAGARAAGISISSAREMEVQFLRTGQIGSQNFQGLIAVSKNFAATIGTDSATASKTLTDLFANPAQGAQQLYRQYGLIDSATAEYVQRLTAQNRATEAQAVLLAALPQRLVQAAEATTALGRAWDYVKNASSNAFDSIGKTIDQAVSGPSLDEKIRKAAQEYQRFNNQSRFLGVLNGADNRAASAKATLDDLMEQERRLQQLQAARSRAAANQNVIARAEDVAALAGVNKELRERIDLEDQLASVRAGISAASAVGSGVSPEKNDELRRTEDALTQALNNRMTALQKEQQLSEIDIRISAERNPLVRAQLAAEREEIQLNGQLITSDDLKTRKKMAYNQVIEQTVASTRGQIADMQTEIDVRRQLAGQVDGGSLSIQEANRRLQEELALRPLIAAAAVAEGAEKQRLLTLIGDLRRAYDDMAETQKTAAAQSIVQDQNDRLRSLQTEISLVGQVGGERRRAMAVLEAEIQIQREGIKADSERARTIRDNAAAIAELTDKLSVQQALGDLKFQGEQFGRPKEEQQVYEQIRQLGLDINSTDGKRVADAIRLNQQLERQREAIDQMASTLAGMFSQPIKGAGDFFTKLASGFASIGQQNLQKAFTQLLGGGLGGSSSGGSILDVLSSGINKLFGGSSFGNEQTRQVSSIAAKVSVQPVANVMTGLSGTIAKTTESVSGSIEQYAAAIRQIESSGNYGALGPVTRNGDRAYGAYQVMGNNIASWTQELLGYSVSTKEFLSNRSLQDQVFYQQFGKSLDKFGNFSDAASVWFSGRPLAGNTRSDGYNTTQQYVNKALAALPSSIKAGAAEGITQSLSDNRLNALLASPDFKPNTTYGELIGAPGAAGGAQIGVGGALSAGLGGFGLGAQSGSPAMGGIGGALSGFMSGGPVGAVVGGIAGLLGGLFGKSQQKAQERAQARQTLNANKELIQQLFALGQGQGVGATAQSYNQFYDKTAELDLAAQKAGDRALVERLRANVNSFFILLEQDYNSKLPGLLKAYGSGLGSNSPFVKGAQEMESLRDEVKNFVADAQQFGDLQLKNNRDLTPEQLAKRVQDAQDAAQKMVLSSITGTRELGNMESALLKLQGSTSVATQTLEQLGMSAEDAAKAVSGALNVAVGKLKDSYNSDLMGSIGELSGVGYVGSIQNALSKYESRLADTSQLGLDGSLALRELSLSIKEIVTQANLGKEQIAALGASFPDLQFIFNGISSTSVALSDATSQLDAAYQKQSQTIDDLISTSKQAISSLKQFRDSMKLGSTSPLSPEAKVAEAARQFQQIADKARTGDSDALGQLSQAGQAYLDAAKNYFASSNDYYRIWSEVDNTLSSVQSATEGQLSEAQKQKAALDAQVNGILKVNDSVLSVKDALDQYNKANADNLAALQQQLGLIAQSGAYSIASAFQQMGVTPTQQDTAYWQNQVKNGRDIEQVTEAIKGGREAQLNELYRQIMGRDLDATGRNFFLNSGKSFDQIAADLQYAKAHGAMRFGGIVGAFASGGMVGNGLYDIDSVRARYAGGGDILLAGGEHVTRAPSVNARTAPTLDYINRTGQLPGNDNSALVAELRNLRAEVASLKAELSHVANVTATSGQVVAGAVSETTGAVQALGKKAAQAGLARS